MTARYEAIAQRLAQGIHDGLLRPGDRLPSLRQLCDREGVSLMTAVAAYHRLEALRLVEARSRSGFHVLAPPRPPRPAIHRSRLARGAGREGATAAVLAAVADPTLVPFGLGVPSAELFPLGTLRRVTGRVLAARPELWASYSPPPGAPELRRQIARRLQARGLDLGADDVVLTAGATEALALCLRLSAGPGDVVAVECPTYFGILEAVGGVGARVVELPGDAEGGVDPAAFESACRRHPIRAAVVMAAHSNPAGGCLTEGRKRAWAAALASRRVALIEDDLYAELSFEGPPPTPLAALMPPEGPPALLVGSLSKTLMPGGRVGYVAARRPWADRLVGLKRASTLSNSTLAEHVAAECLASGVYDRHLRRFVPRLRERVGRAQAAIAACFPKATRVSSPRGGFLLWVELPEGESGTALFEAALDAGISVTPGSLFSLGGGIDRFVRLNAGAVDQPAPAIGRLAGLLG